MTVAALAKTPTVATALTVAMALLLPTGVAVPAEPAAQADATTLADSFGRIPYAVVRPGVPLHFPQDHGSHPAFRTEWWYVTGWLDAGPRTLGFQVTFFRTRPAIDTRNPSAFTPRQLVIAHAAISDTATGHLVGDQRIARAVLGLAGAREGDADVWLDNWRLTHADGRWTTRIDTEDLSLTLRFDATQPPLVNGDGGYSRKGPRPESASGYYSLPQLAVSGRIRDANGSLDVTGTAWLDHEWSSEYLDADASGWDWVGLNLDDGGALMAFRIRTRDGRTHWAGGTRRHADGRTVTFAPEDVRFTPGRTWRSPRTGTDWPVEWTLDVGSERWVVTPLFDDQEHDTRGSTGAVYWEGAVRVASDGGGAGRGYLELTGYGTPLVLP